MRTLSLGGVICLALAACSTTQTIGELPTGFYGTYQDNDVGAINQSSWALASPRNTNGDAIEAIKAVIAVEWLSDELEVNPRWIDISPLTKQHMRQARNDLRQALGVREDAPSPAVIAALLSTIGALQSGYSPGDMDPLRAKLFTLSPQQTMTILTNLPYVPSANIATSEAASQILRGGGRQS